MVQWGGKERSGLAQGCKGLSVQASGLNMAIAAAELRSLFRGVFGAAS